MKATWKESIGNSLRLPLRDSFDRFNDRCTNRGILTRINLEIVHSKRFENQCPFRSVFGGDTDDGAG